MLAVYTAALVERTIRVKDDKEMYLAIAAMIIVPIVWFYIKRGARAAARAGQQKVSSSMQNRSAVKKVPT